MTSVRVWQTDMGTIELPADFPMWAMRKNGWPDKRRKITAKVFDYIDAMKREQWKRVCDDAPRWWSLEAPSFEAWQK